MGAAGELPQPGDSQPPLDAGQETKANVPLERRWKKLHFSRGFERAATSPGLEKPEPEPGRSHSPARDVISAAGCHTPLPVTHAEARHAPTCTPSHSPTHPLHPIPQPPILSTHPPCPTSPTPACTGVRPGTHAGCAVTQLTRPAAACFAPANYGPPRHPHSSLHQGLASLRLLTAQRAGRRGGLPRAHQLPSRVGLQAPPRAPVSVGTCAIHCRAG